MVLENPDGLLARCSVIPGVVSGDWRMVVPVAESYPHVVDKNVRDADCEAQSEQTLCYSKYNQAAITAVQSAANGSPN